MGCESRGEWPESLACARLACVTREPRVVASQPDRCAQACARARAGPRSACQQALAPRIHDQSAQGAKTGCLQKMLSIINHVYQAIKKAPDERGNGQRRATAARLLRDTLWPLRTFDPEMNATFALRPKCCYCSSGVAL